VNSHLACSIFLLDSESDECLREALFFVLLSFQLDAVDRGPGRVAVDALVITDWRQTHARDRFCTTCFIAYSLAMCVAGDHHHDGGVVLTIIHHEGWFLV
jgi:hypothetical protein